jgi:hypothetical protein
MKLVVCAKSDNGAFIGMPSAANYSVFTARETAAIDAGDILANPAWDDEAGSFVDVKNLSKQSEVRVEIVDWSMTLEQARKLLEKLDPKGVLKWHPPWPG